ncbi:MAG: hypothetical protein AAGF19_09565, partial [Pseudomonadota bacterium]
ARDVWAGLSDGAKEAYGAEPAPGTAIARPQSGLEEGAGRDDEAGFAAFQVCRLRITALDYLHLAATGHRRAQFLFDIDSVEKPATPGSATWLSP